MTTIYHNPRCSKSRATLALLEQNGITPSVVLYLETPPDKAKLKTITTALDCSIRDIIRKGETLYQSLGVADTSLSEDALLALVAENPILLERPIVIRGKSGIVGRPPENVLGLL